MATVAMANAAVPARAAPPTADITVPRGVGRRAVYSLKVVVDRLSPPPASTWLLWVLLE
jgi:hypothetical protein